VAIGTWGAGWAVPCPGVGASIAVHVLRWVIP
jgi:hypothetical protein